LTVRKRKQNLVIQETLDVYKRAKFRRKNCDAAAYEATICAAILNAEESGNRRVFLTLLGGGAFRNETEWIASAIKRTLDLYRNADLEVAIVGYASPKSFVQELVRSQTE